MTPEQMKNELKRLPAENETLKKRRWIPNWSGARAFEFPDHTGMRAFGRCAERRAKSET